MRALAALCVRRPVFTWVLVLSAVVLGLFSLDKMPIERFPNVDFAFVAVTIHAPGMSAEQVESEIVSPLENAVGTVQGLVYLNSTSAEGVAKLWANFSEDKSSALAAQDVRDRVSHLVEELPPGTRPPVVETYDANVTPILEIAMYSPAGVREPVELSEIAETQLARALKTIDGVGGVRLVGGATRALTIVLDPLRLRAVDLTAQEVQASLARENLEVPGGQLSDGARALGIRLLAKARTAIELSEVVVAQRGNLSVRVGDLGRVEDGAIAADSHSSLDGRPCVLVTVTKQPGANTVAVADTVRARLAEATRGLPDGVTARIIYDNSEDIRASVQAVTEHLVLGAIMAALVVLWFLRSWRATLIAALAIPCSVLATFAVAHALGMTLNLLSLLGLTLAVGIVIDDAIVVLENVVRMLASGTRDPRRAAVEATREIGLAVLATTLSLVAVFLPVATMEGVTGRYLAPFGLTMSASILLSMGVAFTLTPMLCSRWLSAPTAEKARSGHGPETALDRAYLRMLRWVLARRGHAALVLALTLASILPLWAALPRTFIPVEDTGRIAVYAQLPESMALARTAQVGEEISLMLRDDPDVVEAFVATEGPTELTVVATLRRRGLQEAAIGRVRDRMRDRYVKQNILTMVGASSDQDSPGPDGAPIQFVIRGGDLADLQRVARALLAEAKQIPGTVDHGLTTPGGRPELSVRVDRARARELGVAQATIGAALALVDAKGVDLGSMRDPHSSADASLRVYMRVASDTLVGEDLVRAVTVRSEHGEALPLAELATLAESEGPGTIRRGDRQRQITLFMNTEPGTNDARVLEVLDEKLRVLDPKGLYRSDVMGEARELEKTTHAFTIAVLLSLVFMYLILAAQFESWLHPVTILMSLPLTVPFGLLALLLGGQSVNLFSGLGFLVLFGVVKKNSILQIDRTLQLRAEGVPRGEAVLRACADRLRPILMTTLAFVAGMLPLVVSSGAGAATNRAIGVGILGGQTLSLVLTLLATPVLYTWFDDAQAWWQARRASRTLPDASASLEPR
ncbi:MAG: efflux RND transporter permease subunit [Polyangiales bacterium]